MSTARGMNPMDNDMMMATARSNLISNFISIDA